MKKLMRILALAMLCIHVMAQPSQPAPTQLPPEDSPEALQRYVPVLPSVKAQFWKIDPKLGYAVKSVEEAHTSSPITDGNPHFL